MSVREWARDNALADINSNYGDGIVNAVAAIS